MSVICKVNNAKISVKQKMDAWKKQNNYIIDKNNSWGVSL